MDSGDPELDHPAIDRPALSEEPGTGRRHGTGDPSHHRDAERRRAAGTGRFARLDGAIGEVTRTGMVIGEDRPGPADPVVVQVSRWDRLKDMSGVMRGFADHVVPLGAGYLMLLGPAVSGVADDPEGAAVFGECLALWQSLPAMARARVLLVTLPLDDVEENAAAVNAIQRYATVIVQKSLAEGFGLTGTEGMWNGLPWVGSALAGILAHALAATGLLSRAP